MKLRRKMAEETQQTQPAEQSAPPPAQEAPKQEAPKPEPAKTENAPKKGGSSAVLIIVIVLVILAVLGVGGYFVWKAVAKKISGKITGLTGITSVTPTSTSTKTSASGLTVKSVEDMLKYPNGTITENNREKYADIVSTTNMTTSDGFATVQDYYVALANKKSYTVTKKSKDGTADTGQSGFVNFDGKEFTVEIYINQYAGENTTIEVTIHSETLPEGSGITATSSVTPTTSAAASSAASTGDYVISDSSTREISKTELTKLTPWQLKVARNEIYARHGREFVHKDLQCYFAKKSWYKVDSNFSESSLSTTENKNVATILAYEQEISSPLYQTDSGCDTNS